MAVKVDNTKCTGCGSCVEPWPLEAMAVNDALAAADPEACVECGVCMEACPNDAISLP